MGRYSYSQPSSSSSAIPWSAGIPWSAEEPEVTSPTPKRRSGKSGSGFPERCLCGLVPVLNTSTTDENPGRVFYGCRNYKDSGDHIFKWWDEAVIQEIQNLRCVLEKKGECRDRVPKETSAYLPRIDAKLSQLCYLIDAHYPSVVMKKQRVTGLILTFICLVIYLVIRFLRS